MKLLRTFGIFLILCAALTVTAAAQEAVTEGAVFQAEGFSSARRLWDGDQTTWSAAADGGTVTVSREDGVAGLYLLFDRLPQPWTLDGDHTCGESGFLHQYVDVSALLGKAPESVTLTFPEGTALSEIYALSPGELPGWVQVWQPPLAEADLMLVSSHSDDEQLFFAGILPYYAVERQLAVQVVYFVQHFEANGRLDHQRPHEQLDGLWTVGIRNYPIISDFPDLYSESKDREKALASALSVYGKAGQEYDDFVAYLVACIRRCRPLVVVSHDVNGEYGHGTHVLCSAALSEAVSAAAHLDSYPDSAGLGPWQVEKTYFHLYDQNPITLDLDTPLDSLGGRSPFQVTQDGFACHKSQHWTWFYKWIYGTKSSPITKAADIKTYSPCLYGLFDSQVGPDLVGNDFFEHVESYAVRLARAEEAAQAAREAEQALKAQEEAARLQAEEAAREALLQKRQAEYDRRLILQASVLAGVLAVVCVSLFFIIKRIRRR